MLPRSIFDNTVYTPEHIDFLAGAICVGELQQRLPDPAVVDGTSLDSRELPDLSDDEETRSLLEDTIKGALASARLAAQEKDPELVKVLRQATVDRDSEGVNFEAEIPAEFLHRMRTKVATTAEAR